MNPLQPLDRFVVDGRRAWSAHQIGVALGRDPSTFASSIRAFDVFVEGTDYAVLPGGTVLLFDAGVHVAASRYPTPAATALRQALVAELTAPSNAIARAEAIRTAARARHVAAEIDAHELAAWEVFATALVLGQDGDLLRGPIPTGWSTPTQIGHRLGVTAHRVGMLISELGLRKSGPLARPRIFERHGRPIVAWIYAPDAERQIADHLRAIAAR